MFIISLVVLAVLGSTAMFLLTAQFKTTSAGVAWCLAAILIKVESRSMGFLLIPSSTQPIPDNKLLICLGNITSGLLASAVWK